MRAPKNEDAHVPPEPVKPEYPITWYFNTPRDMPWISKTRNTHPPLVVVTEVIKTHDISGTKSRSVRPHGWQQCLVAKCLLADPFGERFEASLTWPALVENAIWAQNDVVRYIQDWLPGNLQYVGRIINSVCRSDHQPAAAATAQGDYGGHHRREKQGGGNQ